METTRFELIFSESKSDVLNQIRLRLQCMPGVFIGGPDAQK